MSFDTDLLPAGPGPPGLLSGQLVHTECIETLSSSSELSSDEASLHSYDSYFPISGNAIILLNNIMHGISLCCESFGNSQKNLTVLSLALGHEPAKISIT